MLQLGTWLGHIMHCFAGVGEVSPVTFTPPYMGHRDEEDQLHYAVGPICVEVVEIFSFECL